MIKKKIGNVKNGVQKLSSNRAESGTLSPFCFYEALGYPIPLHSSVFAYQQEMKEENGLEKSDFLSRWIEFSREKENLYHKEYLMFLKKWSWLYKQFPFVDAIYLANSMTFNALHADSDIDLFVVAQERRVWLARFFMTLMMRVYSIKRTRKITRKRFCLSFFIDRNNQNLEALLLHRRDIYLPYWIAHLVPIYLHAWALIYSQNLWIQNYLPNWSPQQYISLGIHPSEGRGLFRKIIEICFYWWIGDFFEYCIQKIWSLRIRYLIAKKPELHRGVLYTESILKFHNDKRNQYSELIFRRR